MRILILLALAVIPALPQCGPAAVRKPIGNGQYSCVPKATVVQRTGTLTSGKVPAVDASGNLVDSPMSCTGGNCSIDTTLLVHCGGTDDTANIQAALNGGGKRVITTGASCVLTAPLIVSSNTWLDLGTSTLSLPAGGTNLIRNAAVGTSNRAITDASFTNGSKTLTSASANFAAADVGSSIYVADAGPGGATVTLNTTIAAVTNATTITMGDYASRTLANRAATIYRRDSNITLTGGTITRAGAAGTGTDTYLTMWRRVDALTVSDVKFSWSAGKYAVSIADATEWNVSRCKFNSTAGGMDPIHVAGPSSNGVIRDVRGVSGDDFIGVTARDWTAYDDVRGDVLRLLIDGVAGTGSSLVKLEAGVGYRIRNVTLRNLISTGSSSYGVLVQDSSVHGAGEVSSLLIDGIAGAFSNEKVRLGATTGRDAILRNLWDGISAGYHVNVTKNWNKLLIDGGSTNPWLFTAGTGLLTVASGATVEQLQIRGLNLGFQGAGNHSVITIAGTVTDFNLRDVYLRYATTADSPYILGVSGTVSNLDIAGLRTALAAGSFATGPDVQVTSTGTITALRWNDCRTPNVAIAAGGVITSKVAATCAAF